MAHAEECPALIVHEGDEQELLPRSNAIHKKYPHPTIGAKLAIGASCLLGALSFGALLGYSGFVAFGHPAADASEPFTVRALLEGDELASAAADNLLAMGSAGGRDRVREQVRATLQNISSTIRIQDPEAHRRLGLIALTADQKDVALSGVRRLGDARVVSLTQDIAEAVRASSQDEAGAGANLERHLADHLAPKLGMIQQLRQEMYPGSSGDLELNMDNDWHAKMQVDFARAAANSRRLQGSLGNIDAGDVHAQAHTLFKSLESQLGEQMPKAPARLLTSSGSDSDTGFMTCVMKAAAPPSPTKMAKCFADNMSDVLKMLKGFMKGKMR